MNGELVDEEKLDNDPFIQRVMADVEAISRESVPADEPEQPSPIICVFWFQMRNTLRLVAHSGSEPPTIQRFLLTMWVILSIWMTGPIRSQSCGMTPVQLLPTGMSYPIYRAESRERFEQLLREDNRNDFYTEFLPANLDTVDQDLRDVLAHGLIGEADKGGAFRASSQRQE